MGLSGTDIQMLKRQTTESISSGMENGDQIQSISTAKCGSLTMGQSQMGSTSTTKMEIPSTTNQKILNVYQDENIPNNIDSKTAKECETKTQRVDFHIKRGLKARPELSGEKFTQEGSLLDSDVRRNLNALCAEIFTETLKTHTYFVDQDVNESSSPRKKDKFLERRGRTKKSATYKKSIERSNANVERQSISS